MGNFTGNMTAGLSTSDGISLSKTLNGVAMNAKAMLDDNFAGAAIIDLAPLMASIADPKMALMICDGEGATLKFDGVAAFTNKAYKTVLLEMFSTPSGVLDLEITMNGTSTQRVRFLCMGD